MTDNPITAPPARLFEKGGPSGPGRAKGSRNKLATSFFDNLYGLWGEQGEAVLRRAAFEKPMEFAAMVAKLMPQKLEITTPTEGMSEERFAELLDMAERMQALSAAKAMQAMEQNAPMTIEGSAYEVEKGAYPEVFGVEGGKDIDLIHTSASSANPPIPDPANPPPQILRPAPKSQNTTTATSETAIPSKGNPIDLLDITACPPGPGEEDIDPLSLF